MYQEERVTNVHGLLGEISAFIDEAPAKKTEQVDWERFSDHKRKAQESLDSLRHLFSPNIERLSGCSSDNPKIPKISGEEEETEKGCTKTNPQIPQITSMEVEKSTGCSSDNPKIPKISMKEDKAEKGCTDTSPKIPQ